jgi:transposase
MYIQRYTRKAKNKVYTSVFLAQSFREDGKVKRKHLVNLSKSPEEEVRAIEIALAAVRAGKIPTIVSENEICGTQHKSIGAIHAAKKIADQIGITASLGKESDKSKLVLLMIFARLIFPGSKASNMRWAKQQEVQNVLGIDIRNMDEESLYSALDWLNENQEEIELKLFFKRHKNKTIPNMYLYDVTSSYLEGDCNELGTWGYNRDKKKGKKQIVIGLLTDEDGMPVSVRVFQGNTSDTATVPEQILTLRKKFRVKNITLIGDKGMIKIPQAKLLNAKGFHYITTISRKEIRTLANKGILQLTLFDNDVAEVEDAEESIRYIYRKNPVKEKESRNHRNARIAQIIELAKAKTIYLAGGSRRDPEVAFRHVERQINKFNLKQILTARLTNRVILLNVDEDKKKHFEQLDGCYVVKTDLPKEDGDTKQIHDKYKGLAKVESAFRTVKSELEIRPLFHRKAERTKAHVFVCMLAYMIDLEFKRMTYNLAGTSKEHWNILDHLMTEIITIDSIKLKKSMTPSLDCRSILSALKIAPPQVNERLRGSEFWK